MSACSGPGQGEICYIPSQTLLCSASKQAEKENPIRLFFQDALVLFRLLRYLPWLFLPLKSKGSRDDVFLKKTVWGDTILQILLFVFESLVVLLAIPAFFILPGLLFLAAVVVVVLLIHLLSYPLTGPTPVHSSADIVTGPTRMGEEWIFLNGCASSHNSLQSDVDCLARIFGRPVTGIHNKTFGLVIDILECLVQRCFGYRTTDVRVAYESVKPLLCDPKVKKVVLIGHSQGGITISLVIDELLAELPQGLLTKLEIYTFGSAARHLHNPPIGIESKTRRGLTVPEPKLLIPHIEHYANERDMVPRWGVLNSMQSILTQQYAGQVFVNKASGHMFVQHYIAEIFSNGQQNRYLDRIVKVDQQTLERRETDRLEHLSIESRKSTGLEFGDGERIADADGTGEDMFSFDRTASGHLQMLEAKGKTVRQLSRLWRYQGGRDPDDRVNI